MVDSVSSSTAAEVATTVRQQPQARPAEEARSRPAERKEAEAPPPPREETKVTLKQAEPQPNTADRNAKPVEQYQNVQNASVLR